MKNSENPAFPSRGGMLVYVPEKARGEIEKAVKALDKQHSGMTLRQYAAIQAMQGFITGGLNTDAWEDYEDMAKSAVSAADALLAELSK